MSVTIKFIILIAAGVFIIPLFGDFSVVVFVLYNLFCFCLLFADFFLTPKAGAKTFDIKREPYDKLFFKTVNTISFNVRNNSKYPLTLTLKDEPADFHFTYNPNNMTCCVSPNTSVVFSYETLPSKRGAFLFPNIRLKLKSRMGFCHKYAAFPLPIEFKVYPNLTDLSKYRLLLTKNARLENGKRIINIRGTGQEFESLREYIPGDDFRKINHNASARMNKHILNLYETEKNQPVFIMLDTGRAMSYTLKGYKKLDYAINAALILSDIVNKSGDNSGLCVFGGGIDSFVKPGKGPGHRNTIMETLYHICDTNKTPFYNVVFKEFTMRVKRRSLIFLFTDFETNVELDDLVRNLQMLKKRHLPVVCLMKNDSVIKMSQNQEKTAQGIYEKAVALDYLAHRSRLVRSLNIFGIACIQTEAENFAIDAVNHYLTHKSRSV